MAKIRSNKTIYKSRHGQDCFISREMINFNQDKQRKMFVSIVREQAFIDDTKEVVDEELTVYNEETGEIIGDAIMKEVYFRKVIEDLGTKAHKIPYTDVNGLFNQIGQPILANEVFTDSFDVLQSIALRINTQVSQLFATDTSDWINDDDNGLQ